MEVMPPARLTDAKWLALRGFRVAAGGVLEQTEAGRVADWVTGFLGARGGTVPGAGVHAAAAASGISGTTLKRARRLAGATAARHSNGRGVWTVWALPESATATAAAPDAAVPVAVRAS